MRKVSRAQEQFSEINFRTAQEKEAINLNVVHDVANMAPHALNALKDVGHGIGQAADAVGHGIGKAVDWAKDTIVRPIHDTHNYYDDVSNKAYEISQDLNHLKVTKDDMANAQGVIDANDSGHLVSALGAGAAALAVPGGIAKGIGMGINKTIDTFGDRKTVRDKDRFLRRHPIIDKFSSFDDSYAFEKTAKEEGEKGFKPPAGVQSAARHALKLIEEGKAGKGFTSVGRGRAHQLANGETLSLSTVKRMHSYFSRHRVDKKGKDWDNNSPGKVAWLAWGGDAGASWAAGICAKHDGKDKD